MAIHSFWFSLFAQFIFAAAFFSFSFPLEMNTWLQLTNGVDRSTDRQTDRYIYYSTSRATSLNRSANNDGDGDWAIICLLSFVHELGQFTFNWAGVFECVPLKFIIHSYVCVRCGACNVLCNFFFVFFSRFFVMSLFSFFFGHNV